MARRGARSLATLLVAVLVTTTLLGACLPRTALASSKDCCTRCPHAGATLSECCCAADESPSSHALPGVHPALAPVAIVPSSTPAEWDAPRRTPTTSARLDRPERPLFLRRCTLLL